MIRVRTGVLAVLVLAHAGPALAQRTTGEIIGRVTDESGGVLPGVTVTLTGAGVAGTPSVITLDSGAYRFPLLPPGTYDLEYALAGFTTLKRAAIPVSVGATVELEVKLTVGGLTETATSSARRRS